eukprot:787202-Alexandrium_andersonii.AAC.1
MATQAPATPVEPPPAAPSGAEAKDPEASGRAGAVGASEGGGVGFRRGLPEQRRRGGHDHGGF